MKLHKLLYYPQGWQLGLEEEPLLTETLEAWMYSPVVLSIHLEFRSFGASPIMRPAMQFDPHTMT